MDMVCVCLCVIKYQCLPIIYQSLLESSSECCLSWFFVSTCCKPDMCSVCLLWHYRIFRNTSSVVNQCTSNCFRLFFKRSILKYVYVLFWSPESLRWTIAMVGFHCVNIFSRTTGPILTKFGMYHLYKKLHQRNCVYTCQPVYRCL